MCVFIAGRAVAASRWDNMFQACSYTWLIYLERKVGGGHLPASLVRFSSFLKFIHLDHSALIGELKKDELKKV